MFRFGVENVFKLQNVRIKPNELEEITWETEIANNLPALNSWQTINLALFSYGVIQAENTLTIFEKHKTFEIGGNMAKFRR